MAPHWKKDGMAWNRLTIVTVVLGVATLGLCGFWRNRDVVASVDLRDLVHDRGGHGDSGASCEPHLTCRGIARNAVCRPPR